MATSAPAYGDGRAAIAFRGSVSAFRRWLRALRHAGSVAALARHLAGVN